MLRVDKIFRVSGRAFVVPLIVGGFLAVIAVPAEAEGPEIFVSKVQKKTLVDRVEALGTLKANESVTVSAQTTEIITSIMFEDGQRVLQGQVLVEVSSAEEKALLAEAEAAVREAKAQLQRTSPLAERGISSGVVLSERKRDFDAAVARVDAAKSRLEDRRIVAPFAGVVGLRNISVGALVVPGTSITTIDDDSVMKLDFAIPSTFLATIRLGLPIQAKAAAFGDRVFTGKVVAINSRVDEITRSITVRASIPNPEGQLRAGLLMIVEVLKNERQAMVIPERAVISRGNDSFVFVVDPNSKEPKAVEKKVALGQRSAGEVEVTDGLLFDDYVVIDGTLRVKPGQAVTIAAIGDGAERPEALLKQQSSNKNAAKKL